MIQGKAICGSVRRCGCRLAGVGIAAVVLVAVAVTPASAGTTVTIPESMSDPLLVEALIAAAIAIPIDVWDEPGDGIDRGQVSDTPGGGGFVAVAAGWKHSLALKSDGSILAWGDNYNHQVGGAPQGAAGFTSISAYGDFSLALQSDGSIVAWGYNFPGDQIVPPAESGFVAVDCGFERGFALRQDGSILGFGLWGRQEEAPGGAGFLQVAGRGGGVAIEADGSITCWGHDSHGQVSEAPRGGVFTAVDAAPSYCLALRDNGALVAWGEDDGDQFWDFGQVADAPEGDDFTAIAAGAYHALALQADGSIVGWGRDDHGQVSDTPAGEFVAIAAGAYHSLALRSDGSLAAWGCGTDRGCETIEPIGGPTLSGLRQLSPLRARTLLPEPGALALLAFSSTGLLLRRRQA